MATNNPTDGISRGGTVNTNAKYFSIFHALPHIDFMGNRKFAYMLSGACILISLVVFFTKGINLSIDFRGGVEITLRPSAVIHEDLVRGAATDAGYVDAEVKTITDVNGNTDMLVRIKQSEVASQEAANAIVKALSAKIAPATVEIRQVQAVGPKVGKELVISALWAILVFSIMITIFLWWRFEWIFGVGATIALVHDVLITAGFVALLGKEYTMQIVAALLTILGYSVNDTIVVYDRIRENVRKHRGESINTIINLSVNETLSRTVLTAGTVIMALVVLFFLGGQVIHDFAIAMLFGVTFGTYSSVFVASSLLIDSGVKDLGKAMAKKGKK